MFIIFNYYVVHFLCARHTPPLGTPPTFSFDHKGQSFYFYLVCSILPCIFSPASDMVLYRSKPFYLCNL